MEVKQYRKKSVVVEAVEFSGDNWGEIYEWMWQAGSKSFKKMKTDKSGKPAEIVIKTSEGEMIARAGDFIVKDVGGEFYPVKPDIFQMTYEEVRKLPVEKKEREGIDIEKEEE